MTEENDAGKAAHRARIALPGADATPEAAPPGRYSMAKLEELTGFSSRTIRFYITQGLLPPAHGRGPSATYDRTHLLRLQAIRALKERHLPLESIKTELGDLRDDDIAAQLEAQSAPTEDRWRRIEIHPDLELHVREPGGEAPNASFNRAVDLVVKQARLILQEMDGRP